MRSKVKSINGFIGLLITAYIRSRCPDVSPLVYPFEMPGKDLNCQWRVYVPDLTRPGTILHSVYSVQRNQLIKEFCDDLLTTAGYNPEVQRNQSYA